MKIIIVGGGASGVFAALACREAAPDAEIVLLEKGELLRKVSISGGGRCNCSHAALDLRTFLDNYPRGGVFLRHAVSRFGPKETTEWFGRFGVPLTTEKDGRIFPASNRSSTITDCFTGLLASRNIPVTPVTVTDVHKEAPHGPFTLILSDTIAMQADRILLATGGLRDADISTIIRQLGHTIVSPIPSLFSFVIRDTRISNLPGVAVDDALLSIPGTRFRERGPLLITHNGLSGPAMLALSSRAARYLFDCNYRTPLTVSWYASFVADCIPHVLNAQRHTDPKGFIASRSPFSLPGRLWQSLVSSSGISPQKRWSELSKTDGRTLASAVTASTFATVGMDTNKKEFVTCGGVSLDEVDRDTMESRICKGLFFSGELLDIDGLTGGYNLQAAWATGYAAGNAMVNS